MRAGRTPGRLDTDHEQHSQAEKQLCRYCEQSHGSTEQSLSNERMGHTTLASLAAAIERV